MAEDIQRARANTVFDGDPAGALRSRPDVREALELVRCVRRLVRAENIHARRLVKDPMTTSRDDTDLKLMALCAEWPAWRLDKLRAALASMERSDG